MRNEGKVKVLLNGVDEGNETMHANIEHLKCSKVEALGYF